MSTKIELEVSGTEAAICKDIASRQQLGIKKYGTTVRNNNLSLRQWLQHSYEEKLDDIVYMRRAIEEIDEEEALKVLNQTKIQ
jgi:hypothetical protein